ncbi:MAG: diphosphomevalonate decarboxylase [Anaerolineae bacterium]|nr:diphosphomevalonate decarboxylase [Anaerolineae bacterium]
MTDRTATAQASPNIALIKYWGNRNNELRLPVSSSLSFNLAELHTQTTVTWSDGTAADTVLINGEPVTGGAYERVVGHLDHVRKLAGTTARAAIESSNNFPTGAGIASSAAAFAALSLAATAALGLALDERALSTLARLGSGSAARSIPGGFVAWYAADEHANSYAETIAPPEHWALIDLVAVISQEHKQTGSTVGHSLAPTSPLQAARNASAAERFEQCQAALLTRDFPALADVTERDSNVMHAVMMTSEPPLFYWQPETLRIMESVRQWRKADGHKVCYTIDAGPNVHCICTAQSADAVEGLLRALPGVLDVRRATVGGPAHLVTV